MKDNNTKIGKRFSKALLTLHMEKNAGRLSQKAINAVRELDRLDNKYEDLKASVIEDIAKELLLPTNIDLYKIIDSWCND